MGIFLRVDSHPDQTSASLLVHAYPSILTSCLPPSLPPYHHQSQQKFGVDELLALDMLLCQHLLQRRRH